MSSESEERIAKIEQHLAHLEKFCDELSGVVREQGKEIRRLLALNQKLSRAVESAEMERIKDDKQKPPHYSV